jgi:MYND finger
VSPLARCPCGFDAKTYYKCCWKDNGAPTYLNDYTGFHFSSSFNAAALSRERLSISTDVHDPAQAEFVEAYNRSFYSLEVSVRRFREESPRHYQEMRAQLGPKSKMPSWDRFVYAAILQRLYDPFLWKDVHWDLDRPELLRRAREWNAALERLCDDIDVVGEERERIVSVHTANPCGPCGFTGCDAFESEVREFQRSSLCKKIAYCGRKCQKKDWAERKKVCKMTPVVEPS